MVTQLLDLFVESSFVFNQVAATNGTILSSPLFVQAILPFLLVFTVVFAILQKTKILGDGKKQIDAIVSLVIGLIVISFGFATGVIVSLVPVLAISAVVILVFMLLYGMTHQDGSEPFKLPGKVQGLIGALVAVVVVVSILVITGAWDYLVEKFFYSGAGSSALISNVVFIVIIVAAIGAVLAGGGKPSKKKSNE